jgi:hypothetical protein
VQDREDRRAESEPKTPTVNPAAAAGPSGSSREEEDLEKYSRFFASLTKKPGGSAANSPRAGR